MTNKATAVHLAAFRNPPCPPARYRAVRALLPQGLQISRCAGGAR